MDPDAGSRPRRPRRRDLLLLAAPLAVIAIVTAVDLRTPQSIHLGPFLVAAPAITASFASPLTVAGVGLLSIGALALIGALQGDLETPNHEAQIAALVVVTGLLMVFRLLRDRRERELDRARSVAHFAQRVLLKPLPARIGPLRIASVYLAAEQEALIGGDAYAATRVPGGARLIIGDVRGKGLPAVEDAATLLGTFRGAAYRHLPLPGVAAHLGNALHWERVESTGTPEADELFVTAALLDVLAEDSALAVVNCGHPPPLLVRDGQVRELDTGATSVPLGIGATSSEAYTVERFDLKSGDVLLLYTDGVTESRSPDGAFYPLVERIAAWRGEGPGSLVRHVRRDLLAHAGGILDDDAALVAVEVTATGPQP